MPALIDSHAHLGDAAYDDDRADVLQHAAAAGVEAVVVIGYDADSSVRAIEVARQGGPVSLFATAGVAPHHVLEVGAGDLDRIRAALDDDIVVAVGEIGLDYHYDMPPEAQRELFSTQLEWARETGLPAVIHSREAEDDVVDLLREHGARAAKDGSAAETPGSTVNASPAGSPALTGVIHCFTESAAMAEAAVGLGFYISFSGIITFRNAADIRLAAARVPLERMLIETDSPYLAPVPYRGKRNEPAFVGEVAKTIADLRGIDAEQVIEATTANARRLFNLPGPDVDAAPGDGGT